jgi:hypothetical protein
MSELGNEHRGHAIEGRAALGFDRLEGGQRIETLARVDHGRAVSDAGKIAQHHAEAVIERHGDAHFIPVGQALRLADEIAVVEEVVVSERGALGRAGRTTCELDVDRVVELQLRLQLGQHPAMPLSAHSTSSKRT